MFKLIFLGSGSAFVTGKENYHSNVLIENDGQKMLYDAGTTINDALDLNGTDVMDIDKVFISHLHGDHSAGMEFVGFKTYFSTFPFGEKKVEVVSSPTILEDLWHKQLCASMDSLDDPSTLETYFKVSPFKRTMLKKQNPFDFAGLEMEPVSTIHSKMESYGLMIKNTPFGNIFISGDTKFTPDYLQKEIEEADLIFHDCEFNEYPGGVHAQFHELKTLSNEIKSKMYLYHYMLNGKTFEELEKEVKDSGFMGLVRRGFTLEAS